MHMLKFVVFFDWIFPCSGVWLSDVFKFLTPIHSACWPTTKVLIPESEWKTVMSVLEGMLAYMANPEASNIATPPPDSPSLVTNQFMELLFSRYFS
jgi:hypothetical protein